MTMRNQHVIREKNDRRWAIEGRRMGKERCTLGDGQLAIGDG